MTKLILSVTLTVDLFEADVVGLSPRVIEERLHALAGWGQELKRQVEADPLASRCMAVAVRFEPPGGGIEAW